MRILFNERSLVKMERDTFGERHSFMCLYDSIPEWDRERVRKKLKKKQTNKKDLVSAIDTLQNMR